MDILLSAPALNVFEQMALDECIVRARPRETTLRFYRWTDGPAVTFGYAQFVSEVRRAVQAAPDAGPLARRPTGGGVVFHRDDLTFSLVFVSPDRPSEIYRRLHACIHEQLARLGASNRVFAQKLPSSAYAPSQHHAASACFRNPVENDLLASDGAKVLGGAIRRFGQTVLYQGSLQWPGARGNPAYKKALIDAIRLYGAVDLKPARVDETLLQTARRLAQTQYSQAAWTEKF